MKMFAALLAVLVVSLTSQTLTAEEPQVPRKAAELGIQTGPDKYLWLSQYHGKTCILAFILTTCPHCQFTVGLLNRIQTEYAGKDVQVIASAIEPMSSLNIPDFQKKFQPSFPIGYNEQTYVAKFLGYPANEPMLVPQLVFVDRNGVIRVQYAGDNPALANDKQEKSLREALEKTIREGGNK